MYIWGEIFTFPMGENEPLFELIQSLSKSEKRYFKLFSNLQQGEKNYLMLFEAIEKQKKYDEKKLLLRFRNQPFANYFSESKRRLYANILKVLEIYYSEKNVDGQLISYINQIAVLYEKSFFKQCWKLLLKAKNLAAKHEKYLQLLELYKWEKQFVLKNQGVGQNEFDIKVLLLEEEECIKKIVNESQFRAIRYLISDHYKLYGTARSKEEKDTYTGIINNILCSSENNAITFNSKYDYFFIYSFYYQMIGDMVKSNDVRKKMIALVESYPECLPEREVQYITALTNYSVTLIGLSEYEECLRVIEKMQNYPVKSEAMKALVFKSSYTCALNIYINTGEYSKGVVKIKEIEEGLPRYSGLIHQSDVLVFYYCIAQIYFGEQNYSRALEWVNKIFNDPTLRNARKDILSFTYLFNLIIHFEKGDYDILTYYAKNTHRYLYKIERLYAFEEAILDFIREAIRKGSSKKILISIFRKLKNKLEELVKDPLEKEALQYFDIIYWLESKIDNKSFGEIIRKRASLRLKNQEK